MFDLNLLKEKFPQYFNSDKKIIISRSIATAVFLLVSLFVFILFIDFYYQNKFSPNTHIGDLDLSNKTKDQSIILLEQEINKINQNSIIIKYKDGEIDKNLVFDLNLNPDFQNDLFVFDVYGTIYENFNDFYGGNFVSRTKNRLLLFLNIKKISPKYTTNDDYLIKIIKDEVGNLDQFYLNAKPKIICNNVCVVDIEEEKGGFVFDYQKGIADWRFGLEKLKNNPIILNKKEIKPQIFKKDVLFLINDLNIFFNQGASSSIDFYYQDKKYSLNKKQMTEMIVFEDIDGVKKISVDFDNFKKWFEIKISSELNVSAVNAMLEIKNGKINNLSTHKKGKEVDINNAFNQLKEKINNNTFDGILIELKVNEIEPEVVTGDVNDLGIKEIIGTGHSNFSGSPTNRIKNIKNGASKLHGLLIKPDEEFSLIKALLPIDAENGYFTELVIKGNKTVPEYGGGLCQIGTTMFRAVLASGLPVLERQNHSYSVSYYLENGLPGTDATIYDPKPDFRFKNDTGHYILIQSRIEGSNIYFDFWGTKDGRKAERTKPKTWGLKVPPPTKIIETINLKPGEKKCTESSHNGISASFNYIVNYPTGDIVTTTFSSVYRPWQAVCLVGVSNVGESTTSTNQQSTTTEIE